MTQWWKAQLDVRVSDRRWKEETHGGAGAAALTDYQTVCVRSQD